MNTPKEYTKLWIQRTTLPAIHSRISIFILQPAFVNNPFCGLLILAATFLNPDWRVGLGMILGGSIATIGEMVSL